MSDCTPKPQQQRKQPFRSRRRRLYFSKRLSALQAKEIFQASWFAAKTVTPLNRFITIHLERGGVVDNHEKHTAHFLKQAGDWLRRKGHALSYVWVREAGYAKGEHVHILMHIPSALPSAFSMQQRRWLCQAGILPRKGVIRTKAIGLSYKHCFSGVEQGQKYQDHLNNTLSYILKESEPATLGALDIQRAPGQSELKGKRYCVSVSLGPAARKRLRIVVGS